jgi:hypothetical protein
VKRSGEVHRLDWLKAQVPGGGLTGYAATGWDASIWIPHAMYETDQLPGGLTHDDLARIERDAGASDPTGFPALDDMLSRGTLTGAQLGWSAWPGPRWKRLLWREHGRRLGIDPFACFVDSRSFPHDSWPVNIAPPAEGSLDREQFFRLVEQLEAVTPAQARCCSAFYAMLATNDLEERVIYRGGVRELVELYKDDEHGGSPSNIWPDDRSWFVYTDWDLWATKISGPRELIDRLASDPELEAVRLRACTGAQPHHPGCRCQ